MTGLVLHPGHDELHGITVVISGASGRTYVGRWHEQGSRGIAMRDVAIHDPATVAQSREDWLAAQRKFGVAIAEKHLIVPDDEAVEDSPPLRLTRRTSAFPFETGSSPAQYVVCHSLGAAA